MIVEIGTDVMLFTHHLQVSRFFLFYMPTDLSSGDTLQQRATNQFAMSSIYHNHFDKPREMGCRRWDMCAQ